MTLGNINTTIAVDNITFAKMRVQAEFEKLKLELEARVYVELEEFINQQPKNAYASILEIRPDIVHCVWINPFGAKGQQALLKQDAATVRMILASRGIKTKLEQNHPEYEPTLY